MTKYVSRSPTFEEIVAGAIQRPFKGFFKSSLPLEVLWSLNIHYKYPDGNDFVNNDFNIWVKKTWGVGLKYFTPEQLISNLKGIEPLELVFTADNGLTMNPVTIPLATEVGTGLTCLGIHSTDYADKVICSAPGLWLQLTFYQPLLHSNKGAFIAYGIKEGEEANEKYPDWLVHQ